MIYNIYNFNKGVFMETDFLQLPKVIEDIFLDNAVKVVFSNRKANTFEYKKADEVLKKS